MSAAGMFAALGRADAAVFHFINGTLYWRPLADLTLFLASDQLILVVLLVAALAYQRWSGWRRTLAVGAWGAAAVACSSLLHNEILKPFFNRTRPFLVFPDVHLSAKLRDLSTMSLSFPSTHSASAAALAIVVTGLDPRLKIPAILFAAGIGLGAVYSGGHYPGDVAAGYGVGCIIGFGLRALAKVFGPPAARVRARDC